MYPASHRNRFGKIIRLLTLPVFLAAALGSAPLSPARADSSIEVTTFGGGSEADDGQCSLLEAITNANDNTATHDDCGAGSGNDTITFANALGSGSVVLSTQLPAITDANGLTIDGGGDVTVDGANTWNGFHVTAGNATFQNITIKDATTAYSGGGLLLTSPGTALVEHVTFQGNDGTTGGAIYNPSTLTVKNSTFDGNSAGSSGGGAIYADDSASTVIVNSTFSNNSTTAAGGALMLDTSTALVYNSTFSGNSASVSNGAAVQISGGILFLYNSILANSSSGDDCVITGFGASFTGNNNLIEDSSPACGVTDGTNGSIVGVDPALGSAAGPAPLYFPLNNGSPAIDAGSNADVPGGVTTDQAGNSRFADIPWKADTGSGTAPIVDMGSYEATINCPGGARLYVDAGATGAALGTSWTDAFPDLQMALYSVEECGAPSDVWVAAGLYKPDGGDPGNRVLSFKIPPGSSVYGGFAGGETLLTQQDWQANVTVLSGDIDDDDISPDPNGVVTTHANIRNNNSYHVVTMDGTVGTTTVTASTVLDGFTITAGRANSSGDLATGGGLFCNGSGADNVCSPTLRHLVFSGNLANSSGGGLYNGASPSGSSSPALTDVTFVRNHAGNGGGGMTNYASFGGQSNPVLNDVTFDHNSAAGGAGMSNGAYQGTSSPTLTDVVFDGNTSSGNGGGMWSDGASGMSNPSLTRVTFTGNSSTGNGGAMYGEAPGGTYSPILTDVTFQNNTASQDGGAMYNKGAFGSSNPTLVNVTFTGNSANGAGGAMYNNGSSGGESSPDIHNSTFYGNGAATVGDGTEDGGAIYNNADGGVSSPTLIHVTISGNEANVSGGGIYNSAQSFGNSSGFVINSIVWGNTALSGAQIQNALGTPYIGSSVIQNSFPASVWDSSLGTNGGGNTESDPLLLPLADNGGLTQTIALAAGSSALGTADGDECLPDDQRGVTRPQGVGCDIGAYEKVVFADVPVPGKEWMEPWIEAFYNAGITTGCGINPLRYCPENQVTRAEMAVFLLRAVHGAGYAPPAPAHDFADVPVTGKEWMEPWIEQFYEEGITTGCGGGNYCPENNVTRAEMAVFVLRALHGGAYSPPAATHTFADVPVTGKEWMEPWIDQFAAEGITTGCGGGNYCPENNVTRAEMAVFIDRAYGLYP